MRGLRSHLTYANVISTLCLILVLGGGAAYAANTVFSSDIVDGEVRNRDLAANSVQSGKVANDNLTGTDIDESSLQNVNAGTVSGLQVRKINFQVPDGTGPTTVLDLAGLRVTAECQDFGDSLDVKAFTSKNRASAYWFAGAGALANDTNSIQDISSIMEHNGSFDVGDQLEIDNWSPNAGDGAIGTLNYSAPDGSVVVAHLALDEVRLGPLVGCALTGIAIGG